MNFKFELGQIVTHITKSDEYRFTFTPATKYVILGRGTIETLGGVEELYLVGYNGTDNHFYKHFVYVQELQALKTEENDG